MSHQKLLPKSIRRVLVPPIKCQGIKTKLIDFILSNIQWDGRGRWIEPFLGSGVVLFNVQPERALINDANPHIIEVYRRIYNGTLTPSIARNFLTEQGQELAKKGGEFYYEVRKRFNDLADPLDFLFLNRSCFNGIVRFNSKGKFNVPFCRKPERFSQAYVTKIANQVATVRDVMKDKDWEFRLGDWRECFRDLQPRDFVYLDPPYIGRHVDYFNRWSEKDAVDLAIAARSLPCGFALSMWKENKYRSNPHIGNDWQGTIERTTKHFYHVGSTENLRNEMEESLLIKPQHEAPQKVSMIVAKPEQLALTLSL